MNFVLGECPRNKGPFIEKKVSHSIPRKNKDFAGVQSGHIGSLKKLTKRTNSVNSVLSNKIFQLEF
jgi:hypothetical protein